MDQLDHQLGHDRWTTTRLLNLSQGLNGEQLDQEIGATILQVSMQHRSEVLHILQRLGVPNLPDDDVQEWQHLAGRGWRRAASLRPRSLNCRPGYDGTLPYVVAARFIAPLSTRSRSGRHNGRDESRRYVGEEVIAHTSMGL